jgi:hypothetical protein
MKQQFNPNKKYCSYGKHMVDKDKFYRHPTSQDGKSNTCIECVNKRRKDSTMKIKEGTIKAF